MARVATSRRKRTSAAIRPPRWSWPPSRSASRFFDALGLLDADALGLLDFLDFLDLLDLLRLASLLRLVDLADSLDARFSRFDALVHGAQVLVAQRLGDVAPTHLVRLAHGQDLVHRLRACSLLFGGQRQEDGDLPVSETLRPVILDVLRGQLVGCVSLLERELRPLPLIDDLVGYVLGIGGRAGLVDLLPVRGELLLARDVELLSRRRRGDQQRRQGERGHSNRTRAHSLHRLLPVLLWVTSQPANRRRHRSRMEWLPAH